MTARYFNLDTMGRTTDRSLAFLCEPPKGFFRQDYRLVLGERAADSYPSDAHLVMDPDVRGTKLSSLVGNCCSFLVCHREMQRVITVTTQNEIEALPVRILNHRGKVASDEYVIINPIGSVACLDEKESGFERSDGKVVGIEELVIDERQVPEGWHLFRATHADGEIIFSKEMGVALAKHDFTNVTFDELKVVAR